MSATSGVLSVDRLYKASAREPEVVAVPPMRFAMVDGHGDPNTSADYAAAIEALYAVSYALKFAIKRSGGRDYRVSPLEGRWWAEDAGAFRAGRKADWDWTMMIAQPEELTSDRLEQIRADVAAKKQLPALPLVRVETFDEGLCAQILHVGPFTTEGPTIDRLHAFIHAEGYRFDDPALKHHEIYLSDTRRAAPEKWRTIVRQPIRPVP